MGLVGGVAHLESLIQRCSGIVGVLFFRKLLIMRQCQVSRHLTLYKCIRLDDWEFF